MPGAPGLAFTPAFSPDGRLIAYSRWKPGGYRDIHLYDLATATDRALAVDRAMDLDPRFSPDGRYVLYSSDRSGINNIYAYELSTRRLFQVTNVLSGAFQPAVSPDGRRLVYTGFTSDGFDLWTMPYDPATFQPAKPFANARLDSPSDPDAETDSPDAAPEDAAAVPFSQRVIPYVPWKYMYPHQWTVGLLQDPFGLGRHVSAPDLASPIRPASTSSPSICCSPPAGAPRAVIAYTYARFFPIFSLSLSKVDLITNGLIVDNHNLAYVQRTVELLGIDEPAHLAHPGLFRRSRARLRLFGLRTDQPDPGRRTDRRHHDQAPNGPRGRLSTLLVVLECSPLAVLDQQPGRAAAST